MYRYTLLVELNTDTGTHTELFHYNASHIKEALRLLDEYLTDTDYDVLTFIRKPSVEVMTA